jgi:protease-4
MTTTGNSKSWSPLAIVLGLSGAFFVLFLIVAGVVFFSHSGHESSHDSTAGIFGGDAVAVLELNGVINESKTILKKLKHLENESDVKAIVLRLDSPGGAVAPSQEIYQAVKRSKKPIIASMSSVAASGAYYVACGTQKIYANAGTITGSIGVIMEFLNLSKLYDWAKVERYSIKTGKFKDVGAEYRGMTADEKELLQTMVDDVLSQFKQAVSEGRKIPLDKVTQIADGRIFSGSQAKKVGLVDEVGTLQDAIDEAGKLGKIKGTPNVIYPEKYKRNKFLDFVTDNTDDDEETQAAPLDSRAGIAGMLEKLVRTAATPDTSSNAPGIYWLWTGH